MPRPLSVFAPNLPHRGDRRHSLEAQFEAKAEFRLTVVPAIVHPRHPPWGLWQTFVGIMQRILQRTSSDPSGPPGHLPCSTGEEFNI